MNTLRIRELTLQIERLEKELKVEKELALENFRNMSEEDIALCDSKIEKDGVYGTIDVATGAITPATK